jgi:hypothetical protein
MRLTTALVLACGLSAVTSISAQDPMRPQKIVPVPTTAPTPLYRMDDVNKSLKLTPEQVTRLNKLTEQTQAQYRDDYTKLGTLNDADRFTRMHELNRQYHATWNKGAGDIFNDTQRARYQQYNYQYGGFSSLYDPDVQKRLNLTDAQLKDLRAHYDWNNQQWQELNRIGANDATKGSEMYRDYWKARQERFNKFLTPAQQKSWNELVGDPYTFQPNFTPQR